MEVMPGEFLYSQDFPFRSHPAAACPRIHGKGLRRDYNRAKAQTSGPSVESRRKVSAVGRTALPRSLLSHVVPAGHLLWESFPSGSLFAFVFLFSAWGCPPERSLQPGNCQLTAFTGRGCLHGLPAKPGTHPP